MSQAKKIKNTLVKNFKCITSTEHNVTWVNLIPLSIGLSFVLSTGPHIQTFIIALANIDAVSIYGSVYKDSIARFPKFYVWMLSGVHWQFLLMAALISFISLFHIKPRTFLMYTIISSFIVLTSFDLINALINDSISITYIIENTIANFFGGFGIGLVFISLLLLQEFCLGYIPAGQQTRKMIAGILLVTNRGYLLSFSLSYCFGILSPTPVRIDVVLVSPVSGSLLGHALEKNSQAFKLLDVEIENGIVSWVNALGHLKTRWKSFKKEAVYDAYIDLYQDCLDPNSLPETKRAVKIENIKKLDVWFDKGTSFFTFIKTLKASARINLDTN